MLEFEQAELLWCIDGAYVWETVLGRLFGALVHSQQDERQRDVGEEGNEPRWNKRSAINE